MQLKRDHIFWLGFVFILLFFFTSRINFLLNADISEGKVVALSLSGGFAYPVVEFQAKGHEIDFLGDANTGHSIGESVSVIYRSDNFKKAKVYSFVDFWMSGIFWCLAPLIFWFCSVYTFVMRRDRFIITFRPLRIEWRRVRNSFFNR